MAWLSDFDRVSSIYDLLPIPTHPEVLRDRVAGVEGPFVDLGGGTGRFTVEIHRPTAFPIVLDPSEGMLGKAHRTGRPVRPVQGIGQTMPFEDDALGAITVTEAFHHFAPEQPGVVAEAARVLRDDGVLLIEEIDPTRLLGRAIELGEHLIGFDSVFLAPAELERIASEAFGEVAVERTGSFTYLVEARRPRLPRS